MLIGVPVRAARSVPLRSGLLTTMVKQIEGTVYTLFQGLEEL
jgi:hypothetical protein